MGLYITHFFFIKLQLHSFYVGYNVKGITGMIHRFHNTVDGVDYLTYGLTAGLCVELAIAVYRVVPEFIFSEYHSLNPEEPYEHQEIFLRDAYSRYTARAREAKL